MAQAKTPRKQVSVSLSEAEYKEFEELAIDLRLRKDSDVLKAALSGLAAEHSRIIFADDVSEDGEVVSE